MNRNGKLGVFSAALAIAIGWLSFECEGRTIALWPMGDMSDPAVVNVKCVNNPEFNLSCSSATVDNSTPGDWHIPPNPSTDLVGDYYVDDYHFIAHHSACSSVGDAAENAAILSVYNSNRQLSNYLYPTNDFTIEGYVKFDEFDMATNNWRIILQIGNGSASNFGWTLSLRYNATKGFYLNMYSRNGFKDPTYPFMADTAFYNFIDGTSKVVWSDLEKSWHHYAVVFDHTDPADGSKSRWRIYFDGRFVDSAKQTRIPGDIELTGSSPMIQFGGRTDASFSARMKGAFSYWRVSDEALDPEGFLNWTDGGTKQGKTVEGKQPAWTGLNLWSKDSASWRWVNTGVIAKGDAISNCTFETWFNYRGSGSGLMNQYSSDNYRSTWKICKWETGYGGDDKMHACFTIHDPVAKKWIFFASKRIFTDAASEYGWYHFALVLDRDTWRLYINGQLEKEESHPGVHLSTDTASCDGVVIGNQRIWGVAAGEKPNGGAVGSFAEARVWNRARTAEEIRANMHVRIANPQAETNLIGYWPLCDGTPGETANGLVVYNHARLDYTRSGFKLPDISNAYAYGQIYGSVSNGLWETFTDLAITGEVASVASTPVHAYRSEGGFSNAVDTAISEGCNRFTFTGWYFFKYFSSSTSERALFSKSADGMGRFHLKETNEGSLLFWIGGNYGSITNEQLLISSADTGLHVGRWTHIALVRDRSKVSIYVDGVLKGEGDGFTVPTDSTPTVNYQVAGFKASGSWSCFDGMVREVGLWKTALTPAQIVDSMTKRPVGNEPRLLGYWPCDDGANDKNTLRNLKEGGASAVPVGDSLGVGGEFRWLDLVSIPNYSGSMDVPCPGMLLLLK